MEKDNFLYENGRTYQLHGDRRVGGVGILSSPSVSVFICECVDHWTGVKMPPFLSLLIS